MKVSSLLITPRSEHIDDLGIVEDGSMVNIMLTGKEECFTFCNNQEELIYVKVKSILNFHKIMWTVND